MEQIDRPKSDSLLDLDFRKILSTIRENIPKINSNAYLMQCRLWLEKLSNKDVKDKLLRNLYLTKLSKQIQENKLLPPFNEAPPKGPLKNIFSNSSQLGSTYSLLEDELEKNAHLLESHQKQTSFILNDQNKNMSGGEPAANNLNQSEQRGSKINFEIVMDENDSWSDLSDESIEPKVKNSNQNKEVFNKEDIIKLPSNKTQVDSTLNLLGDPDFLSQDWKKTITALQLRLSEMIQQNNKLNMIIQKLELQLKDNKAKNLAQSDYNVQILQKLHYQEIAKLKDGHNETIMQLEKTFQANYVKLKQDFEENIKALSNSYDSKISEIKKQNEEEIKNKDNEISRLSEIIQNQCLRIMNDISSLKNQVSNCNCDKKVHVLKKCVSKMDKLFQRSEEEHTKQIQQLKQELELKENSLQVQLKIQKAELVAQSRTGQKEEFEEILNSLEIKYIKMLEGHEQQIMKTKKKDDQKIRYLMNLLNKHGICFDDNFE